MTASPWRPRGKPGIRGGRAYRQHVSFKRAILERDGYRCQLCGRAKGEGGVRQLDVAHIVPHAQGGLSVPENMQVLCHSCNCLLRDRHEHVRGSLLGYVEEVFRSASASLS